MIAFILILQGCGQITPDMAIKAMPQVKSYLEAHPEVDLQVVHYSEAESTSLKDEFKVNCGKDFTPRDIYRFVVSDGNTLNGVGYFDLSNQVLECFKKVNNGEIEVEGDNADKETAAKGNVVVDKVVVSADGKVLVDDETSVNSDGSITINGVNVTSENVIKSNEKIQIKNGEVKVGDIVIDDKVISVGSITVEKGSGAVIADGNGSVIAGDVAVDANGNVVAGDVVVSEDGSVVAGDVAVGSDGSVAIGSSEKKKVSNEDSVDYIEEEIESKIEMDIETQTGVNAQIGADQINAGSGDDMALIE